MGCQGYLTAILYSLIESKCLRKNQHIPQANLGRKYSHLQKLVASHLFQLAWAETCGILSKVPFQGKETHT